VAVGSAVQCSARLRQIKPNQRRRGQNKIAAAAGEIRCLEPYLQHQPAKFFFWRGDDDELDREPGFLGLQLVEALKFNWLLPRFQIRG
jgi:hypothetical protein